MIAECSEEIQALIHTASIPKKNNNTKTELDSNEMDCCICDLYDSRNHLTFLF